MADNTSKNKNEELVKLLSDCEKSNLAPAYTVQQATYSSAIPFFSEPKPQKSIPAQYLCKNNEELFIVSDLHISSGMNCSNVYPGTENFFADEQFARFLKYANNSKKSKSAILLLNGDVFDFLRVTEYPGKMNEYSILRQFKRWLNDKPLRKFSANDLLNNVSSLQDKTAKWKDILKKLGIDIDETELELIAKSEQKYGLRTNNYKSIWKLDLIKTGHAVFFQALADWLESNNKIFIVKGNHDLEWYFLAVRNYLRLLLAEIICKENIEELIHCLKTKVLPSVHFFDDSILIDNDLYVEHGHRYDKFSFIIDNPLLMESKFIKTQDEQKISDELNIPFGSFFNRYLINRVELLYPYIDNVRPAGNILPIMIRERFPLAIKVLLQSFSLVKRIIRTLDAIYIRYMLGRVFWFTFALVAPAIVYIAINFSEILSFFMEPVGNQGRLLNFVNEQINLVGVLLVSYLLSRIVSWFQLSEPDSLFDHAKSIFKENPDYRIIVMGHTHNPGEYNLENDKWFYNTGTWIPIVEASSAEIRHDKTFTYLRLIRNEDNKLHPADNNQLMRWNDDSGRPEPIILLQRK